MSKERLQPSLLDRLTDDEPDKRVETREHRVIDAPRLRESVRRDLTWLFNTTDGGSILGLRDFPEAERSTLNFGVPDLAGRVVSNIDPLELARCLRNAIVEFEPRLVRSTVRVQVAENDAAAHANTMSFRIEAELWSQPLPLRLYLRTQFDLENGDATVTEVSVE
jgi:type VI secretion system protein ImpF